MLDILSKIVDEKRNVENNINFVTSQECENLKLFEQVQALEQAEAAIRSVIRAQYIEKV